MFQEKAAKLGQVDFLILSDTKTTILGSDKFKGLTAKQQSLSLCFA